MLALAAVAVAVGCLVPSHWLLSLPNEKLPHFLSFDVLATLASWAAHGCLEAACWLSALLALGWLIECLRMLVPDRNFARATWAPMRRELPLLQCAPNYLLYSPEAAQPVRFELKR